jgi:Ca2+-binding EF-hand superfamily protein
MGRGGGGDGSGWGRRNSPDGQGGRSQRIESLLRQFDANGDGMITPDEVDGSRRALFENVVRRAGLNPAGPVSVQALAGALSQRGSGRAGGPPQGDTPTNAAEAAKATASLVPGFGPPSQGSSVQGFGAPAEGKPAAASSSSSSSSPSPATMASSPSSGASKAASSSSPSSSGSASSSPDRGQVDSRVRKYAESLMRQYDKNKNGVLEKEEWMLMRGSWRDADSNGDGIITLDELTAKLGNYSQTRQSVNAGSSSPGPSSSGSSPGTSSGSSESAASTASSGTLKKSYRFLSPQERLPKGLPDWFLRKDADSDGQVTMAEYAPGGWSESMAEEFTKYDLNGDGIVTPEECLKAANSK